MKKILIAFMFLPMFLAGCFEDKSNDDVKEVNPIVIDLGSASASKTYSVQMFDTLKIAPLVYKIGTPDAKLSYEWRLHSQTEDVDNFRGWVIDSTMSCCACITAPPSTNPYYLKLTVTDEETGIRNFEMFNLKVLSPFAEGLVVADTRDGQTSDLSLVIDRCFNGDIADKDDTRIFRNVWSEVNGAPVNGQVKGMMVSSYQTNRSITVVSDKEFLRADYYDYVNIPEESNENMFMVPPDDLLALDFRGFYYDAAIGNEVMNLGGQLWPRGQQHNERLYSYYMYPSGYPDYDVTHMYCAQYLPSYGFDRRYNRILFCDYNGAFYAGDQLTSGQNAFDVNHLEDYEPLYMGQTNTSTIHLLARQKSTGKYLGLTMDALSRSDLTKSSAIGKSVFDLTAATDIANAKYFAMNMVEDAVYYATDTKVYATAIANISARSQWEAPAGEKITDIRVWTNSGRIDYEDLDPSSTTGFKTLLSKNRMMLITTYNESTGEGRIHAVPIVTLGIGGLEQNTAYHRVFDGFGRILTITYQKS